MSTTQLDAGTSGNKKSDKVAYTSVFWFYLGFMAICFVLGVLILVPEHYTGQLREKLQPSFSNYVEAAQNPNKYGSAQNAILSERRNDAEVLTSDYNKSIGWVPVTCKARFQNPLEGMPFPQNPHKQVMCWWWSTEDW